VGAAFHEDVVVGTDALLDVPLVVLYSLKRLAEQLPSDRFLRIHRSYLVNLSLVREYSRNMVTLDGGLTLPVGDMYRNALKEALG
jgi:two-component system LytT family response regulator